ncbi:unnamed protein product [Protopolystoma xenopodis]|uniref:Uncharacterized protein n=1 Tax=Protopolystoma xenopodis TaxID=117903 RepID=A0A3S5A5Q2_9PLAT|nr:unnamed protein product [Protopolystoma xenopodis]
MSKLVVSINLFQICIRQTNYRKLCVLSFLSWHVCTNINIEQKNKSSRKSLATEPASSSILGASEPGSSDELHKPASPDKVVSAETLRSEALEQLYRQLFLPRPGQIFGSPGSLSRLGSISCEDAGQANLDSASASTMRVEESEISGGKVSSKSKEEKSSQLSRDDNLDYILTIVYRIACFVAEGSGPRFPSEKIPEYKCAFLDFAGMMDRL